MSYYALNKEKVLAKAREKELCECGVMVTYSNRKCHKQSIRHNIYLKSKESDALRLIETNAGTG